MLLLATLLLWSSFVLVNGKTGFLITGNYTCDDGTALHLHDSWYYTLSPHPDPLNKCPPSKKIAKEFVPMISSCPDGDCRKGLPKNYKTLWANHGAKYLMAFYKPDSEDGANMTGREVALLWPQIQAIAEEASLDLISPMVSKFAPNPNPFPDPHPDPYPMPNSYPNPNPSAPWLDDFFIHCAIIDGCDAIFIKQIALAVSFDTPGDLKERSIASRYFYAGQLGRNVWIEFSTSFNATRDQVNEYLRYSMPTLDGTPSVDRYAWHTTRSNTFDERFEGNLLEGTVGDTRSTSSMLTSTGEIYSRTSNFTITNIYSKLQHGSRAYRIPGLLSVPNPDGTDVPILIAVAEQRVWGCYDFAGQHNIVLKRSFDFGMTWDEEPTMVADAWLDRDYFNCTALGSGAEDAYYCMFWDPTPVYDEETGELFLFAAYTNSQDGYDRVFGSGGMIFMWTSKDQGKTWSKPFNMTKTVQGKYQTYGCTPANGHGIQMKHGEKKGRLLVPFYNAVNNASTRGSFVIYSDNHGKTWHRGYGFQHYSSEGSITEMPDGTLYFATRNGDPAMQEYCNGLQHCRGFGLSEDGGETWIANGYLSQLPDPGCKSSVTTGQYSGQLYFTNNQNDTDRINLTLSTSTNGIDWDAKMLIYRYTAGYTDIAVQETANGTNIGIIFEQNNCGVLFATIKL